jgi:hypothetical protein
MSGVDFAAIQVGDKVKIRWGGLVSEDWMEVIAVSSDDWVEVNGWRAHQEPRGIDIIAHQPAPRKVEVTLGEPLTHETRSYEHPSWSSLSVARLVTNDTLYLATGECSTVLAFATARQLALDILATTGVEA